MISLWFFFYIEPEIVGAGWFGVRYMVVICVPILYLSTMKMIAILVCESNNQAGWSTSKHTI